MAEFMGALAAAGFAALVVAKTVGVWDEVGTLSDTVDKRPETRGLSVILTEIHGLSLKTMKDFDGLSSRVAKLSEEVGSASLKLGKLQESVNDIKSTSKVRTATFQELVNLIRVELKKDSGTPKVIVYCKEWRYALQAATLIALGYGYMHWKGITISDAWLGTKLKIASTLSSVTTNLGRKSDAFTEKMKELTERIENYEKLDEQTDQDRIAIGNLIKNEGQTSKLNPDQEYSDHLFNLVMKHVDEYDESLMGKAFDHLNEDHVAARGFISKRPNIRKEWLQEFAKKHEGGASIFNGNYSGGC